MRTRLGGRRAGGCARGSPAIGCDACAVRVGCGAVWASAPAASSEKMPAKAIDNAAVLIRILTPTQVCDGRHGLRLRPQRQLQPASNPGCVVAEPARCLVLSWPAPMTFFPIPLFRIML